MKTAVDLMKESLQIYEKLITEGRPIEEVRYIGDFLSSMAMSQVIYEKVNKQQEPPRDCQ